MVLPLLWAQTTIAPASTPSSPTSGSAGSIVMLAFRRWSGSLTLSQPDAAFGPISNSLWIWLLGLAGLLVLVVVAQGPSRAFGQLLDMPGHARLLASALDRFRLSGRLLAWAIGVSVLAWTANQTVSYNVPTGREDMVLLIKGRRLSDVALNQGYLAAMTPLRDVVGLGMMIPLLCVAAVVLFQLSTDRWGSGVRPSYSIRRRAYRWSTIGWGGAAIFALYRFVSLVAGSSDLPYGGCFFLEAPLVPAMTALGDGLMVAWVLVELRNAGLGDPDGDPLDPVGVSLLIPAAILACVLAFPSRYLGMFVALGAGYLPTSLSSAAWMTSYLRWQLGWGLVVFQGAAMLMIGLFGAVAWSRGTPGDALRGYGRLLRAEGGHLVAAVAAGGVAAGALSAVAYLVVLSLPTSTWVLNAADSYAHYASIPVGLVLMAALIDLGERSLPAATLSRKGPAEGDV